MLKGMVEVLEIYTVAFFGHRYIDNPLKVEELLEEQVKCLSFSILVKSLISIVHSDI